MLYKGFNIKKKSSKLHCSYYTITPPSGGEWESKAATVTTAKKWIDCFLHERAAQLNNKVINKGD